MFKRRRAGNEEPAPTDPQDGSSELGAPADSDLPAHAAEPGAAYVPADRTNGPWDISEVDDPAEDGRLDLGAMWLPGVQGMEVRVEIDQDTGRVAAVTAVLGQSALQVQPFAAPRSGGLWAEVRGEIASGVAEQGGAVQESEGPFGTELAAEVPVQMPDGTAAVQAARFLGIDGPRWFLRGVITGEAYVEPSAAEPLEDIFRRVVVVRGDAPRARGELLELRLPAEATNEGTAAAPPEDESLNPFRRGPEITEIH